MLAAIAFVVLVALVWFWFFRGGAPVPTNTGQFGTGTNQAGQTTGTPSGSTNNQGSNVIPTGTGNSSSQTISINGGSGGTSGSTGGQIGVATVPGVDWLGGSGGSISGGGPTTNFVPKTVNQLNDGSVGGSPGIVGSFGSTNSNNNSNLGLGIGGIAGAAGGCAVMAALAGAGEAEAGLKGAASLGSGAVLVYDWNVYAKQATNQNQSLTACLMRTIVKSVLDQLTNSVVNWINSGFNGQPSFVTNFQQFFTNVGDQAAGDFIRGTSLSFLCSPFQLQIRVAIAQSYARRNNAGSCTLNGVIKNVNSFMNGNFSSGGWGGLIQFTTVPTNNPYGAYAYAQVGLATAQNQATQNAKNNMTPNGFLSIQKCNPPNSTNPKDCKVATPGKVIEDTLASTLDTPSKTLQLAGVAGNIDAIVSALVTQLTTRALYQGFSSLSGNNGYSANYLTPEQQQAQTEAQTLLTDMQARLQFAQQYGAAEQGSIQDIQDAQSQLQTLANCWSSKGKTAQASTTSDTLHSYDALIDSYNNNITRANAGLAALQDFQTQVINITSPADVATVKAAYNRALASGVIITSANVTQAQQDRTTLQASLKSRNQTTATELDQCYATQ